MAKGAKKLKVTIYQDPNGEFYSSLNTSPKVRQPTKAKVLQWIKNFLGQS